MIKIKKYIFLNYFYYNMTLVNNCIKMYYYNYEISNNKL